MKALTEKLSTSYGNVLEAAKDVNKWREKEGFEFDTLFDVSTLTSFFIIPSGRTS